MNKFVPFLLALVIHLLAFSLILNFKNQSAHVESASLPASGSQSIDLIGFSTNRMRSPQQRQHSSSGLQKKTTAKMISSSPPNNSYFAGQESIAGIHSDGGKEMTENNESIVLEVINPTYPQLARQKGIEGEVKLRAHYNSSGIITQVDIIESSGAKILDESAKKALIAWKLKSGLAGSFEKTFQFKLNN